VEEEPFAQQEAIGGIGELATALDDPGAVGRGGDENPELVVRIVGVSQNADRALELQRDAERGSPSPATRPLWRRRAAQIVTIAPVAVVLSLATGSSGIAQSDAAIFPDRWVSEIFGLLYVIHNRRLLTMLDSFRRNHHSVNKVVLTE